MTADSPREAAPVLVTVKEVAEILGVSDRHVRRLTDSGAMPPPVRLGTLVRWRRTDIEAWIAAGCPRRGREGDR